MIVARSEAWTPAARFRTASGSLASAARPRARSSASGSVPGAGSLAITWASEASPCLASATLAACAGVETKTAFARESLRM